MDFDLKLALTIVVGALAVITVFSLMAVMTA